MKKIFLISFFLIFFIPDISEASSCKTGTWQEYCDCMGAKYPNSKFVGCDVQSGKPPEKSPSVNIISTTDTQNIIVGGGQYNTDPNGNDYFYFNISGDKVKKWRVTSYNDDFSQVGTTKTFDTDGHFFGYGLHANVSYEVELMDEKGNVIAKQKLKVDGLINPSKSSNPNEFDSTHNNPSGNGNSSCDICAALGQMKPAIDGVKDAVKENTKEVKEIKEVTKEISGKLTDFHDEFKTGMSFPLTPMPDVSNLLDKNKPSQNNDVFIDNNTYFKDEGDAPEKPSKMPKAPEPEAWPGFEPDKAMPPEKELEKDKEQQKDKEQEKDKELKADEFNKTPEMDKQTFEKTPELQQETFKKDSEMEKQVWQADQFTQTETFQKDSELNQTHKYQQTNYMGGD